MAGITLRLVAASYWLPCNQSNFSAHEDEDLTHSMLKLMIETTAFPKPKAPDILNDLVFRRLLAVLEGKSYRSVFPIFQPQDVHNDPVGAVFLADQQVFNQRWSGPVPFDHVVFFVNSGGFYVWLGIYSSSHADLQSDAARQETHQMHNTLRRHIFDAVGGDYFSHASGRPTKPPASVQPTAPEETLQTYRDEHRGILTFSQINTILEGLSNANFDPRVYFYSESQKDAKKVAQRMREYSLGNFIDSICADLDVNTIITKSMTVEGDTELSPTRSGTQGKRQAKHEPNRDQQVHFEAAKTLTVAGLAEELHQVQSITAPLERLAAAHRLFYGVMHSSTYSHTLRVFMRATADETLQKIKERIERCRRALLEEMVRITHRRDKLVQVEPPPGDRDPGIEGINETQLRGYVMMLAAKLPLISNIQIFIEDMRDEFKISTGKRDATSIAFHAWRTLLASIDADIVRLNQTIEQAQTDRQLYELEQSRKETETIAEIERLGVAEQETDTAQIDPAFLDHLGIFLAFLVTIPTFLGIFPVVNSISSQSGDKLTTIVITFLVAAMIALVTSWVVVGFIKNRQQRRQQRQTNEKQFYYEIDLHIDAALTPSAAQAVLTGQIASAPTGPRAAIIVTQGSAQKALSRRFLRGRSQQQSLKYPEPHRSSYRVERINDDAAMHKVYTRITFQFNKPAEGAQPSYIQANLVYEIYFHRPTNDGAFILRDLRCITDKGVKLATDEILALKRAVVEQCVNAIVSSEDAFKLTEVIDDTDALFTLNVYEAKPVGVQQSVRIGKG